MKKYIGFLTILAVALLPFCNQPASAVTNGSATQRFTSASSPSIIVYGLVGAYRCSLVFGTSTSGSTGPIDVQGGYNGTFGDVTVNDVGGTPHTSPFTPTMNAQYYFGVTAFDTVQIIPDASWSGQDATGTLACTPAAVAQATSAPVTIATAAIPVNVVNSPGVNIQNTPGFVCVSGCAGGGATIPPELSTTAPLPVATSLPVIGQNYFWNGTGWIAVSPTSPLPVTTAAGGGGGNVTIVAPTNAAGQVIVTTPAPVATVFIVNTPAVNQGTSPWVVNTINPSLPAPQATWPVSTAAPCATPTCNNVVWQGTTLWNVNTPAPVATMFVANTPGVTIQNTPAAVIVAPTGAEGNVTTNVCSPSVATQCAAVNGNNELSTFCVTAQYPCGFPTPVPYAVAASGTGIGAANILANGTCTGTALCAPAIGNLSKTCAVTTTLTQCVAAATGSTEHHITALQVLGEESATGGVIDIVFGTGTNCGTAVTTIPILAMAASFTAGQQVTWGNGFGQILVTAAANEICVVATAGTITTASASFMYSDF